MIVSVVRLVNITFMLSYQLNSYIQATHQTLTHTNIKSAKKKCIYTYNRDNKKNVIVHMRVLHIRSKAYAFENRKIRMDENVLVAV